MRIHEARSTPYAAVNLSLPVSSLMAHAISMPLAYAPKDRVVARSDAYKIGPRITYVDRAIIRDYFSQHAHRPTRRPTDMTTLRSAPPRSLSLPHELECKLSVLPAGYARILSGGTVLLIETATRAIVEVMGNSCEMAA